LGADPRRQRTPQGRTGSGPGDGEGGDRDRPGASGRGRDRGHTGPTAPTTGNYLAGSLYLTGGWRDLRVARGKDSDLAGETPALGEWGPDGLAPRRGTPPREPVRRGLARNPAGRGFAFDLPRALVTLPAWLEKPPFAPARVCYMIDQGRTARPGAGNAGRGPAGGVLQKQEHLLGGGRFGTHHAAGAGLPGRACVVNGGRLGRAHLGGGSDPAGLGTSGWTNFGCISRASEKTVGCDPTRSRPGLRAGPAVPGRPDSGSLSALSELWPGGSRHKKPTVAGTESGRPCSTKWGSGHPVFFWFLKTRKRVKKGRERPVFGHAVYGLQLVATTLKFVNIPGRGKRRAG